jgi:hypothetical protein
MILEGLLTTLNADGSCNLAPMGPVVTPDLSEFRFRPFQTSRTFENLQRTGQGVFHIVDDVLLIAQAALGHDGTLPPCFPAEKVEGRVLSTACRWVEFEVTEIDASQLRSEVSVRVVHVGRLRDCFGYNRAQHAVLEATILATRLHLLSTEEIDRRWPDFASAVEKTGGPRELAAFEYVTRYVADWRASDATSSEGKSSREHRDAPPV